MKNFDYIRSEIDYLEHFGTLVKIKNPLPMRIVGF